MATVKKATTEEIVVKTTKAEGNKCKVCWKINKNQCDRHPV